MNMIVQIKQHFIENLINRSIIKENSKILEFGSGHSKNIIPFLEKYPNITYVGVEQNKKDAGIAADLLKKFKNAKIYNELAYDQIENFENFDICMSLSVLEHVKQLEKFLTNSIKHVKKGGYIIHRYDLGHALYPGSLIEKMQVFLGNYFPNLLTENKYVSYVDEKKVSKILENNGAKINKITYHQMPNHKAFLKLFDANTEETVALAEKLLDWEMEISKHLHKMDQKQREHLFPTITIWAEKI
ncbi:hypothetical protein A2229_05420 [Candidatus Peregrinibacteria bacterium RIFOXYA2_FULL_33_7]|nr:MAG: hypothetical protein UR30_C0003G0049 [Candidatus Peregrinibacteria bacterium GW2011_GWC2_33_13]OGJ50764.1 MAG: hypothetical protein A2229_05420 [Candidatus Peregrinibacteria bacterium RIFOXYA2_FULL_33_7]